MQTSRNGNGHERRNRLAFRWPDDLLRECSNQSDLPGIYGPRGRKTSDRDRSGGPETTGCRQSEPSDGFSDKGKRIDITSKVKNNWLDWTAPPGNWRLIALFCGKTFQQVKRAAPGGKGYVMDHFFRKSRQAVFRDFRTGFPGKQGSLSAYLFQRLV